MEEQVVLPQKEICKAMAEAFPLIKEPIKNKYNAFLKYRYADLGAIIDVLKPALKDKGLWFTQKVHSTTGFASVETIIYHASGESVSCGITSVPIAQKTVETFPGSKIYLSVYDAQGYGSALTYCRKYSLSSAFGIFPDDDDDDGSAASVMQEENPKDKKADKKAPPIKVSPPQKRESSICNQAQLLELAKKAIKALELDDSELDEMFGFLANTQDKMIDGSIEERVAKNLGDKSRFLDIFSKHKKNKLIKVNANE